VPIYLGKIHGVWTSGDGVAEKHYLKAVHPPVIMANAGFLANNNSYYIIRDHTVKFTAGVHRPFASPSQHVISLV
jgi:hypothetical protein